MRRALSLLGVRGMAIVVLLVIIVAVVTIARLVGGSTPSEPDLSPNVLSTSRSESPESAPATADPSLPDDGVATPSRPKPTASGDVAVLSAANGFMKAWLRSNRSADAWHEGIAKYATNDLAAKLVGVDPSGVPATRLTGPMVTVQRTGDFADVSVPVDTGQVDLRLVKEGDGWLVDGVDWARA